MLLRKWCPVFLQEDGCQSVLKWGNLLWVLIWVQLKNSLMCAASPPAWHKVLGLAPRIWQCRCGWGQGGGAQSVPQPAKASGHGLQGWATIHFVQENISPWYATAFSRWCRYRADQVVWQRCVGERGGREVGALVMPIFAWARGSPGCPRSVNQQRWNGSVHMVQAFSLL